MHYTTEKVLGEGGFGKVYLVRDETGARFAMKVFDPQQNLLTAVGETNLKRRFKREVLYQQSISHPNVVKIVDKDLDANPPFFVMELAECTLCDEIALDRTLKGDPRQPLFDILSGLETIHNSGFIHRDLKPQNVLKIQNNDGTFRYAVSDFGLISASQTESTTLTASNAQGGTHHYAPPELIRDFKRGTPLSDIYSFGVILSDIFGGGAPRVPYTEITSIPGAIGTIISTCTKKLPIRRFQNVADLRVALYDAIHSEELVFVSPEEERIVDVLNSQDTLTSEEWDDVLLVMDENAGHGQSNGNIFKAISTGHLQQLADEAPQLLASVGNDFCEYVMSHSFSFDYCDVLGNKLQSLFNLGSIDLKALSLLALLQLGTSHNRWSVENKFIKLAGKALPDSVATRVALEIEVREINFPRKIEHLEWSISTSRENLHATLRALC